jgi:hypothetical protein
MFCELSLQADQSIEPRWQKASQEARFSLVSRTIPVPSIYRKSLMEISSLNELRHTPGYFISTSDFLIKPNQHHDSPLKPDDKIEFIDNRLIKTEKENSNH